MKKSAVLTTKVLGTTFLTIMLCVVTYTFFMPAALAYDTSARDDFIRRMLAVGGLCTVLTMIVVYLIYCPIASAMVVGPSLRLLDPARYRKALAALGAIPRFLFWFGASAYLFAFLINFTVDLAKGAPMEAWVAVVRIIFASSFGFINGIVTARVINIVLIQARLELKVFDISILGLKRLETTRGRLFLSGLVLFVFIGGFAGAILYVNWENIQSLATEHYRLAVAAGLGQAPAGTAFAAGLRAASQPRLATSLSLIGILVAIAALLFLIVLTEMQKHINNLRRQIKVYATGQMDLTARITLISFDDIGEMTSGFNSIITSLGGSFRKLRSMIADLFDASGAVRQAAAESVTRAGAVNGLLSEVDVSNATQAVDAVRVMESIRATEAGLRTAFNALIGKFDGLREVLSSAQAVDEMLRQEAAKSARFQERFGRLIGNIEESRQDLQASAASAQEISDLGGRVNEIAAIISDIADRTNLLAMNASIEAAHAGSAGKGFIVVAREMKVLSETIIKSANGISGLVGAMDQSNAKGRAVLDRMGRVVANLTGEIEAALDQAQADAVESAKLASGARQALGSLEAVATMAADLEQSALTTASAIGDISSMIQRVDDSRLRSLGLNGKLLAEARQINQALDGLSHGMEQVFTKVSQLEAQVARYQL
ncbi:MAG TPA: hypothetical protein DCY05_00380 [Spirochaetaceae bacterium]|nr:hypothetical protein [Spirochaetaceae bacterium]